MSMFDYCTFKLHNIHGESVLNITGQTSIECMFCNYNITEHGGFIKGLRRLRHDTILIYPDHSNESIFITFNWFGAVNKIVVKRFNINTRETTTTEISIPKRVISKWNIDNISDDFNLNPKQFNIQTSYIQRMGYYVLFNYSQIRGFFKYTLKNKFKKKAWCK